MARRKKWTNAHVMARNELLYKLNRYVISVQKQQHQNTKVTEFGRLNRLPFDEAQKGQKGLIDELLEKTCQGPPKRLRGFMGLRIMHYLVEMYDIYEREQQDASAAALLSEKSASLANRVSFTKYSALPLEIRELIFQYALPAPRILILTLDINEAAFYRRYPSTLGSVGMDAIRHANVTGDPFGLPLQLGHIHNAGPPALLSVSHEARVQARKRYVEIVEAGNDYATGYIDFARDTLYLTNAEICNTPQFQSLENFFVPNLRPYMHKIKSLIIDSTIWSHTTATSTVWASLPNLASISVVCHEEGCSWSNNLWYDSGLFNNEEEIRPRPEPKSLPFELIKPVWEDGRQPMIFEIIRGWFWKYNPRLKDKIEWKGPFAQLVKGRRCCIQNDCTEELVCQEYHHWLPRRSHPKAGDIYSLS